MTLQHRAQIYKSDSRGILESDHCTSLATFNFRDYYDDSRKPFGILELFNEETLLPKCASKINIERDSVVVLLPLFGGIEYKDNSGNEDFIRVEQIRVVSTKKGMSFELFNPYEVNVSYLQIGLSTKNQDFKKNSNSLILV